MVEIDLCRDGPHALIAGTTGSGKSELLQTLIAGLALTHPPDRCSFLLIDYKGGAAFAEAAALPHTVGVVTDLDGQTTVRALRSLAAELTRREAILGAHRVTDIRALPDEVPLARLVIVVDEFATLADELPAFVPGLVSIAQRGRSLGVHLVLATQRPSGVVSPEIRANCTLRICLRTTDESDSRDVLGTPAAAFLPVTQPGRAYVRSGHAPPSLLQVARVAVDGTPGAVPSPEVRRWTWPDPPVAGPIRRDGHEDTDLAQVTRAVARHAVLTGVPAPHRPWRPPLPDRLDPSALPTHPDGAEQQRSTVHIGLVDLPDRQSQLPLALDLSEGGTWLVVGGARSGRSTVLRTVLAEAVRTMTPDALHVHVLDPGSGALAADAGRLAHTGTAVGGADALRTVPSRRPPGPGSGRPPGRARRPASASAAPRRRRRGDQRPARRRGSQPWIRPAPPVDARRRRGRTHLPGDRRPSGAGRSAGRCRDAPSGATAGRSRGLRRRGRTSSLRTRAPAARPRPARRRRGRVPDRPPPAAPRPGAAGRAERRSWPPSASPSWRPTPGPAGSRRLGTARGAAPCSSPSARAGTRATSSRSTSDAPVDSS